MILRFVEIASINEAEKYLGYKVSIRKEDAILPLDHYHIHDLIACRIYLASGEEIGVCIDVFSYSSTFVLRISRPNKEDAQIPFVHSFIQEVDIPAKRIIINPIEGML